MEESQEKSNHSCDMFHNIDFKDIEKTAQDSLNYREQKTRCRHQDACFGRCIFVDFYIIRSKGKVRVGEKQYQV